MTAKPKNRRRSPARATAAPPPSRVDVVDAARGFAVAMMIAYHVCFDLTYYGWATWAMLDDIGWIAWRNAIVGSFLFVVGLSLALRDARERGTPAAAYASRSFLLRAGQIAMAAVLVTAGSAALFPQSFIYFGVLHFVVVALWIARRAPRLGRWSIALGVVVIAIGTSFHATAFDPKAINWIGFAEHKPITEDYVPLFPWLGLVLIGCGVGAAWSRRGWRLAGPAARAWTATPAMLRRLFITTGRWSLTIYLVHQPVLLGAMGLVKRI